MDKRQFIQALKRQIGTGRGAAPKWAQAHGINKQMIYDAIKLGKIGPTILRAAGYRRKITYIKI